MKKIVLALGFLIFTLSYVFAEKKAISIVGFEGVAGSQDAFMQENLGAIGAPRSESDRAIFWKKLDFQNDQEIKRVTAYVKHNSSKRLGIAVGYFEAKAGVPTIIASKSNIVSFNTNEVQKVVLDIAIPGHRINNEKYEYVITIDFLDGGDDENLMFYGAKIKLKP